MAIGPDARRCPATCPIRSSLLQGRWQHEGQPPLFPRHSGATTRVNEPVYVVAACMLCRFAVLIFTIRLALVAGPLAQFMLVAVEVKPVNAVPVESAVPED